MEKKPVIKAPPRSSTTPRKRRKLPLYIVEDHNDVLPHIYRLIGRKQLAFMANTMVHFDSHPDMLLPKTLKASDVFDKEKLLNQLSIENWILPMMFAGHVSTFVWIKPPWATQIPDQHSTFLIGKDADDNIKVTCKENYFISEMIYAPADSLTDTKEIDFYVFTIGHDCVCDDDSTCIEGPMSKKAKISEIEGHGVAGSDGTSDGTAKTHINTDTQNATAEQTDNTKSDDVSNKTPMEMKDSSIASDQVDINIKISSAESVPSSQLDKTSAHDVQIAEQLTEILAKASSYILDIDLDFFSTQNPFKVDYTSGQYSSLRGLYRYTPPRTLRDADIAACIAARRTQMAALKDVFDRLQRGENLKDIVADVNNDSGVDVDTLRRLVDEFQTNDSGDGGKPPVDWTWLHEVGTGFDDSELPHHVSSPTTIRRLAIAMETMLLITKATPNAITVARSSNDDYCPKQEVELIQTCVLSALGNLWRETMEMDIVHDYETQPEAQISQSDQSATGTD